MLANVKKIVFVAMVELQHEARKFRATKALAKS